MNENRLYSYTSLTEMLAQLAVDPRWMRVKQGLTIENTIDNRVLQQDNASTTSDLFVLNKCIVPDNDDVKLDDKVRALQHKQPFFKKYDRYHNKHKHHEWSLMRLDDIMDTTYKGGFKQFFLDFSLSKNKEDFLYKHTLGNDAWLRAVSERIRLSKKDAINELLHKDTYEEVVLRPWQQDVCDEMYEADKKYNLLSLAPRFGKTLTVLEYVKRLASTSAAPIVLVPASKNLSSNSSFVKDYTEKGYGIVGGFDIIDKASLFKNEEKILEYMKANIPAEAALVLVTDEADLASHTSISQEKLKLINDNFNVIKQISMSGTGIFKAAKIFKGIPEEDIYFRSINYTELFDYNHSNLVSRNFFNVQLDTEDVRKLGDGDDYLNISQSMKDPKAHATLAKYINHFIDNEDTCECGGVGGSKVTMVFLPPTTKKMMNVFVSKFEKLYPDLATMIINGDDTTNREAESDTKERLDLMKKNEDERRLVLFSMGMASRSFSIPSIRKVIYLSDGFITPTYLQATSRGLTYDTHQVAPQASDIIRISFEPCNLAAETFMLENEKVDREESTAFTVRRFLNVNSFADILMHDNDEVDVIRWHQRHASTLIDQALKFSDDTNYLVAKLFGCGVMTDVDAMKQTKTAQRTANTSAPRKNVEEKKPRTKAQEREDERELKAYMNVAKTLPYIFAVAGKRPMNVEELLKLDWSIVETSKELFEDNMQLSDFADQMHAIFRLAEKATDEDVNERIMGYYSTTSNS